MKTSSHGLVIDGFVRNTHITGSVGVKTPKINEASNLLKTTNAKKKLKSTAQNVHKGAQRSQTLMRGIVQKPRNQTITATPRVQHKKGLTGENPIRTLRAKNIVKSPNIRRYSNGTSNAQAIEPKHSSDKQEVTSKAVATTETRAVAKPMPSMVTSVSHQQLERLLDQALTKADAHKRALNGHHTNKNLWQKIKFAPRWLTVGVTLVIVMLVATLMAYRNIPQVAMKVASTRAHVSAQVPGYTPSGFNYASPVDYGQGSVSIKFKSGADSSRSYTLTQKNSNMTSKSLADTSIPKNTQVQTSQIDGNTVYIYGENNDAVWVNHGIQFTIHDEASLNSDQLLKIASSL